jgi:PAS domain S-box-containing protein
MACPFASLGKKRKRDQDHHLETRINSIVDTAVDGIIVINSEGIIEHFNPASEKLFGYRVEEVIGKNVKILMPQPYR